MAQAHIYVRVAVSGSNADVLAIEKAGKALQAAVEAVGEWRGDVQVVLDDEPVKTEPKVETVKVVPLAKAVRF